MSKYIEDTNNNFNNQTHSKMCCISCKKYYLVNKGMEWKVTCIPCYITKIDNKKALETTPSKPMFRIVDCDNDLIHEEKKN
jgi:hypothetical protein